MLRALKWAYDIGVRQERVRIAGHLQTMGASNRSRMSNIDEMMRDPVTSKKEIPLRERQDFEYAVRNEVQEMVDAIMDAHGDWVPGASLMFPDDGHKGRIK